MSESIPDRFKGYTNARLIERIENAPDFGYDDEQVELNRRLALGGRAWRWAMIDGRERVQVYETTAHTYDADNRCTECGAHLAEPHDPTCSRGDVELDDQGDAAEWRGGGDA